MKKLLSVLMAAAMLVGVLSLAGCGGNGGETTTDPAADADNSAATTETAGDLTTVTAGKLTMSTNAQFPPYEMVADDGSFEGIDIEVADAIAKKLGLALQVDDMDFDAAGRPERQERHGHGWRDRERRAPGRHGLLRQLRQGRAGRHRA